jgi:hypothetical protein
MSCITGGDAPAFAVIMEDGRFQEKLDSTTELSPLP